jgi:hypothetical protein
MRKEFTQIPPWFLFSFPESNLLSLSRSTDQATLESVPLLSSSSHFFFLVLGLELRA